MSTFQVVLVPTVLGVLTNELFPSLVRALKPVLPLIGVALTTLLCASPCAQVASILKCARPPQGPGEPLFGSAPGRSFAILLAELACAMAGQRQCIRVNSDLVDTLVATRTLSRGTV